MKKYILILVSLFVFKTNKSLGTCLFIKPLFISDSTVLLLKSDKTNPFKFYYNGFFLERPIVNKVDTLTSFVLDINSPVLITVFDSIPNKLTSYSRFHGVNTVNSFLVYQNESLLVQKGSDGLTRMVSKDSVRTNELSFFVEMEKKLGLFDGFGDELPLRLTASERLDVVEKLFMSRMLFLENYQKNHTLSNNFLNQVEKIFYYKRLSHLMSPYYSIYNGTFKKRENLIDNKIDEWIKFDEEIYFNHDYRGAILGYLYYFAVTNNEKPNLEYLMTLANQKLKNKTKEVALYDLLLLAVRTGNEKTEEILSLYVKYAAEGFIKDYAVKSYKPLIDTKHLGVGSDILNSPLVSSKDFGNYTWNDILNVDDGNIKYIDFWASWCAPCIVEMPLSMELNEQYNTKGIQFVYVSMDENLSAWKKAIARIGLTKSLNFNMADGLKSNFAKKFKIQTIPHYMIIGKDGKVINQDAPRPSDPKIRQIFGDLLKKK